MRRGRAASLCALVVATTLATFMPWAASGQRVRSSYELADAIDRSGLLHGPSASLVGVVYAIPVLAGLTLLALVSARPRLAGIAATTVGATAMIVAIAVELSPLRSRWGLWLGVVAATGAIVSGSSMIRTATRHEGG